MTESNSGSARAITVNTLWNIAGMAAPLVVAVFAIPLIIRGLGVDRFGMLALVWTVIGYFGAFDLGLGVATTKFVAEFRERGQQDANFGLVVTSACLHLILGALGAGVLAAIANWLAYHALNIPSALQEEFAASSYILALSIPVIVVTACFRGALEGLHRFDIVNIIKIPASIANYVTPLIVLWFTQNLAIIVSVIAVIRLVVLGCYAYAALRAVKPAAPGPLIDARLMSRLLRYGGWLSVSNFVTPIIVSLDRFLIGAFVSAGAVAYYATPYEVITKLWIFSAGLLGVLLPVFSAMSVSGNARLPEIMRRAVRILLALVAIPIGIVFSLGGELLQWWLGPAFREHSMIVSHWIAFGMLFNVVAQVPLTALHGIGRTDVTARILFVELVLYASFAYYMAVHFGINGVACAWAVRSFADAVLLFAAGNRLLPRAKDARLSPDAGTLSVLGVFLAVLYTTGSALNGSVWVKLPAAVIILGAMGAWVWLCLVANEDRIAVRQFVARIYRKSSTGRAL